MTTYDFNGVTGSIVLLVNSIGNAVFFCLPPIVSKKSQSAFLYEEITLYLNMYL